MCGWGPQVCMGPISHPPVCPNDWLPNRPRCATPTCHVANTSQPMVVHHHPPCIRTSTLDPNANVHCQAAGRWSPWSFQRVHRTGVGTACIRPLRVREICNARFWEERNSLAWSNADQSSLMWKPIRSLPMRLPKIRIPWWSTDAEGFARPFSSFAWDSQMWNQHIPMLQTCAPSGTGIAQWNESQHAVGKWPQNGPLCPGPTGITYPVYMGWIYVDETPANHSGFKWNHSASPKPFGMDFQSVARSWRGFWTTSEPECQAFWSTCHVRGLCHESEQQWSRNHLWTCTHQWNPSTSRLSGHWGRRWRSFHSCRTKCAPGRANRGTCSPGARKLKQTKPNWHALGRFFFHAVSLQRRGFWFRTPKCQETESTWKASNADSAHAHAEHASWLMWSSNLSQGIQRNDRCVWSQSGKSCQAYSTSRMWRPRANRCPYCHEASSATLPSQPCLWSSRSNRSEWCQMHCNAPCQATHRSS